MICAANQQGRGSRVEGLELTPNPYTLIPEVTGGSD